MAGLDLFARPSTADTGERNDHDFYETPAWMTLSLLAHHPLGWAPATVLEPCVGAGAISRALAAHGHRVLTNDIDERHPADWHIDATNFDLWEQPELGAVDWVVTNPPFNIAFPILMQAERLARVGVAMLLRKTFLEPTQERGPWFTVHPPHRMIGLPRHNFRGKGSDSVSTDWYIWLREPARSTLPPFVIDYRAKERHA